jgi:hypothetical protein
LEAGGIEQGSSASKNCSAKGGKTGYTVRYRIAKDGLPLAMWVHPNPDAIGILLDVLGRNYWVKNIRFFIRSYCRA